MPNILSEHSRNQIPPLSAAGIVGTNARSRQPQHADFFSKTVEAAGANANNMIASHETELLSQQDQQFVTLVPQQASKSGLTHQETESEHNLQLKTLQSLPATTALKQQNPQTLSAQLSTLQQQEKRIKKYFERENQILPSQKNYNYSSKSSILNKRVSAAHMIRTIEQTRHNNNESTKQLLLRKNTTMSNRSGDGGSVGSELKSPRVGRMQDKVKHKIEDFEMGPKIGAGTFGVIHRATDKRTKKEYALKVISKAQIQSREHAEHIVRERNVLTHLSEGKHVSHFIARSQGAFQDKKNVYIQMDLVRGCDLLSRIRGNELRVKNNMQFYTAEVICVLEHLHSNLIIYRDLKPEHVMIDQDGHCKLVDFGFAKRFSRNDAKKNQLRTFTNCGTPDYIAPEILRGVGASFQADIWSLGVLMTEIISGKTPFHDENPQKIYENVIQCRPRYAPSVSGFVRSLLKTIFVADPGFRATLEQIKQHAVFKRINWQAVQNREMTPQFVPDESFAYHNCNERAQVVSRGALPDNKNLAMYVFMEQMNTVEGDGPIGIQPDTNGQQTIHDNKFVQIQKDMAMQIAMNADMPMAKGIVDAEFLEKNNVVKKRKAGNPLGNFWQQNIDSIFKDF